MSAPALTEYTVTGIINTATGELIISGTYEGHHESLCDHSAVMADGWQRWADTFTASSWHEAEELARADHTGVVWAQAREIPPGDTVLVNGEGPGRVVAEEPAVLQHAGSTEVVITFTDHTTWTIEGSHQVKTI